MHQEEHGPLAADEGQHVRQDPVDGVVDGALLLEDHPGQVQEELIALDLESRHKWSFRPTSSSWLNLII